MCCTYIVPRNSAYFQPPNVPDKLHTLCDEISHFKSHGEIILVGDMNSRVSEIQEEHHNFDDLINGPRDDINLLNNQDRSTDIRPRSNRDKTTN